MSEEFTEWELSHEIETKEDALEYLAIAFEDFPDDYERIQDLLGQIGRGLGMTALAKELGVSRQSLYRSFSRDGNPSFKTVMNFVELLGGSLTVIPSQTNRDGIEEKNLISA